ncbi:MAG: flagellar biosynthesis protein FlhB, partial [Gammaproteobacteria bacterium]|nr:flagellar biosynthesis protein FlhB [Gammaproteobacteria bacterium]
ERTEQATPKRIREAREKGQLPRSRELSTMAMLMSSAIAFYFMGDVLIREFLNLLSQSFTPDRKQIFNTQAMPSLFMDSVLFGLKIITPLLIVLVIVAVLSSIAVSGWNYTLKAIAFKWEKLDPIKGMKRVFSARGLVELLKALIKFLIIGTAAVVLLENKSDEFLLLGTKDVITGMTDLGNLLVLAFLTISMTLILLAVIDVPFQIWDNAKQLKMSLKEIRDEMKQTEGNPEVKSRIRQIQREMAQRRMMEEIPKADVVITNPTHYAIALRYDQKSMQAPVVVAKGHDIVAANIRGVADSNDVPIVSAPPLARALYYSTELEQEIPVGLFQAVAQVLAYVFHIKESTDNVSENAALSNLPIPDELRRDE